MAGTPETYAPRGLAYPAHRSVGSSMRLPEQEFAHVLRHATELIPFGVAVRYPGDLPEVTADEALAAVRIAAFVRSNVISRISGVAASGT